MAAPDTLRYAKVPLAHGSGAIPVLGFATLIPDPLATKWRPACLGLFPEVDARAVSLRTGIGRPEPGPCRRRVRAGLQHLSPAACWLSSPPGLRSLQRHQRSAGDPRDDRSHDGPHRRRSRGGVRPVRCGGSCLAGSVVQPALSDLDALIHAPLALDAIDQAMLARDPAGPPAGKGAFQRLGLSYAGMRGASCVLD
jgi:hypothetical protein